MRLALTALLALVPIQGAMAQSVAGVEKFDCDAPGGAFSRYQRTLGASPASFSAKVHVNQLRGSAQWHPVVNVMLRAGSEGRLGFRFLPDPSRNKTVIVAAFPGGKRNEESIGEADMNAPFDLSVRADQNGTQISVNGMTKSGPALSNAIWTLDLSCSSVDANIDDILLGPKQDG